MASIPGPRDTDAEDVALKLEVAQTQWARGDHAEALKWLRKAADAAFDADDDKRGIELSKLAAELAAQDKTAPKPKPKLPPPRDPVPPPKIVAPKPAAPAAPAAPQVRPAAPAPVQQRPSPPAAEPPASRRSADQKLSATGARRAAAAKAADARAATPPRSLGHVKPEPEPAPVSRRGRSSRKSSPDLDDESTREYLMADVARGKSVDLTKTRSDVHAASGGVDEEWPTEAVDSVEDLEVPPEHRQPRAVAAKRAEARDTKRREAREPTDGAPESTSVPFTQALRVAVGHAPDGRVVVRILDANGLREGERDALLVALTSDGLTTLFT